jgi:F0F1-type ATP synthase assembly protein I
MRKGSLVELRQNQKTWDGFDKAFAQSVEFVVIPLLFALFGHWLDGRFGTGAVLAIVFGLVGLFGVAAKSYLWYRAAIDREEEGKPWTRNHK